MFSLSDIAKELEQILHNPEAPWTQKIPGTPEPSEMWLSNHENDIGLFTESTGVRVVVWVGKDMHSLVVASPEQLEKLKQWVFPRLAAQKIAAEKIAAEEKAAAAVTAPTLTEAIAALNAGKRMQLGYGRWYLTYFMADGKLRRNVFDEGYSDDEDTNEQELVESMKNYPEQARQQL